MCIYLASFSFRQNSLRGYKRSRRFNLLKFTIIKPFFIPIVQKSNSVFDVYWEMSCLKYLNICIYRNSYTKIQ